MAHNFTAYNIKHLLCHTISKSKEFRNSLVEWFWLGYSVGKGSRHLKIQLRLGNQLLSLLKLLLVNLHSFGLLDKGIIIHHMIFCTGCLSVLVIWQLISLRANGNTQTDRQIDRQTNTEKWDRVTERISI